MQGKRTLAGIRWDGGYRWYAPAVATLNLALIAAWVLAELAGWR